MRIRLLRGQVVVREVFPKATGLWTPAPNPREQHTHQGIVLGMGPEVANQGYPEYRVGQMVQYHFSGSHQKAMTRSWIDGEDATWVPWFDLDAVLTCDEEYSFVCSAGPRCPSNDHKSRCEKPPGHDGHHASMKEYVL